MKLLIAIPVYNEIRYVEQVLAKVREQHDQILFIDDGSADGTARLLDSIVRQKQNVGSLHLLQHASNKGYGQSIIDAFDFADRRGFEWVITMDCDEQHEPAEIPAFKRLIESDQWDVISGSRYLTRDDRDDVPPGDRRAINSSITGLMNGLFGFGITDAFCGYKAHRVSAMKPLHLDQPGYAFPLQLWPRLAEAHARITELPVRLIYND
ncbi:MAG: glycosyltransferase family 2 protein, partial [Phycisphaerae bacterium]|nr:glycosyltransferase family 2 protein [Phycisphaerae bacterium]